jgi:arabinan endo-1,5-alpha-L-arabinosidase
VGNSGRDGHVHGGAGLVDGVVLALVAAFLVLSAGTAEASGPGTYANPLSPRTSNGQVVQNCADPSVTRGRGRYARWWYMYCTSDPFNDRETSGRAAVSHRLPMMRSRDLVHWRVVGSALPGRPSWASAAAKLWAPDVVYSSTYRRYYLTFAVTDTVTEVSGQAGCGQDPAIGVATSASPTGPWRVASAPLVRPVRLGPGCSFGSTIDPDVLGESVRTRGVLYAGGFRGGIRAQAVRLSRYGMKVTGAVHQVTTPRRYEGATAAKRGSHYYLFVSSGSCCDGATSGYGVFVGRSASPFGPFLDREGNSLAAPRVGGTPVLTDNGNRWIGPGHNSVFRDFGGQWWTIYHGIDRDHPYFAGHPGYTKRAPMLDPVDWAGGWPSVRSGRGASDGSMAAPAAQPKQHTRYRSSPAPAVTLGPVLAQDTDEFDGTTLDPRWSWVREPDASSYSVDGAFHLATQAAGLTGSPKGSVLTEAAPGGDFVVETAVRLDVPTTGVHDYVQAGLALYGGDDRYVKLTNTSIGPSRVTELGARYPAGTYGTARSATSTVGPPGDVTWLRLVVRIVGGHRLVTGWTSQDGSRWVRGGTWQHDDLGDDVRIGLVSLGGTGFTADFDHVRVWQLGG